MTMQSVVNEVRRYLYGGTRDTVHVLNANITSTTGNTVVVADVPDGVGPTSVIDIGLEQMYVRSVSGKTLTVIRGFNGSTAAQHNVGDLVYVNPLFPQYDMFNACVEEARALRGSGLYQFDTQEFTYDHFDRMYDLTLSTSGRTPLHVQEAKWERSQRYDDWSPLHVELIRDVATSDFPSGYALKVIGAPVNVRDLYGPVSNGTRIRATVAFTIGTPSALTDDPEAFGITDSIRPVLAVGAAWRLALGKEARRVMPDTSHGSRRSEEIQPGAIAFLARSLKATREDYLGLALEEQNKKYPYRMG